MSRGRGIEKSSLVLGRCGVGSFDICNCAVVLKTGPLYTIDVAVLLYTVVKRGCGYSGDFVIVKTFSIRSFECLLKLS